MQTHHDTASARDRQSTESGESRISRRAAVVALLGAGALSGGGWYLFHDASEGFAIGSTKEFTLEEGDGQDPEYNDLAKPVPFEASAGEEIIITQTSSAFDAYMVIEGPSGSVLAEGSSDNTNAFIRMTLPETGEYTIWAGSETGDRTGPFKLTVELE